MSTYTLCSCHNYSVFLKKQKNVLSSKLNAGTHRHVKSLAAPFFQTVVIIMQSWVRILKKVVQLF